MKITAFCFCLFFVFAWTKDPASSWLGYAKGVNPSGEGILTYIEAKWKVPSNPKYSGAYYTPWFGIETSDNMNLLQPVNPYDFDGWTLYNEYFQWSPEHNFNSEMHDVSPGDVIFGSVKYNPSNHSYTLFAQDLTIGWSVSSNIEIQKDVSGHYKNYTLAYFVFEHPNACYYYPTDDVVTFFDIKIAYDDKFIASPKWTTGYVADHCSCRAHIVSESSVKITWDSSFEESPLLTN
eukprot:TRINITY_DN22437_c0_g1_i1.p1 TRINITY_DN22437_c0_g1~~TRINITY_DN22437_c0_g1_i1.p1  ORF type:complete len:235 (+),score=34.41 TRINITY_DN22437_c0_g1_i1:32-736(+)